LLQRVTSLSHGSELDEAPPMRWSDGSSPGAKVDARMGRKDASGVRGATAQV
jgi:hypothetical protein